MNTDSTKRSIGQIIFRHPLHSLVAIDGFNLIGEVVNIQGEVDKDVDKNMLFHHLSKTLSSWKELSGGRIKGYENISIDSIEPIRPNKLIEWDIFPKVYECLNDSCKVITTGWDKNTWFTGKCARCSSGFKQFRYVWYHHCGHIRPFYPIKDTFCPIHKNSALYLEDTGKFKTSFWKCRECNHQANLRMMPCSDSACIANSSEGDHKYLSAAIWSDPWVYFSQVITFVNVNGEQLKNTIAIGNNRDLIMKGFLGDIPAGKNQLLGKKIFKCSNCNMDIPQAYPYCPFCQSPLLQENKVDTESLDLLSPQLFNSESDLTLFSALRDLERSESLRDQSQINIDENDNGYLNLVKIGFYDFVYIGDFPMTNAAIGFSRSKSKPPAWLNGFNNTRDSSLKLPIYTNSITTEAFLVQLSSLKIIKWLKANNLIDDALGELQTEDEREAKLKLLSFIQQPSISEEQTKLVNIIKDLIHSCSHALLYSLSLTSGLDVTSFGEMDIPDSFSFILYANESELGGLKSTFRQGISSLAESIQENLRTCKFDPSCSEDDDGVCIGCLYLPRGCNRFNSGLSRNYLFGGKIESNNTLIRVGFFDL